LNSFKNSKKKILGENILSDLSQFDDLYLLRFLRARKFELDKTFLMFKTFITWRIDNKVDTIELYAFPELFEVKKLYPHGYHKTDKIGRPIYIELTCQMKIKELFQKTTEERMMNYYIKEYEKLLKYRFPYCSKEFGSLVDKSLTIMDMNGVGMSLLMGKTKDFVKIASDIAQNYYPEMLGTMFLINCGMTFSLVWNLVKGFIDTKTKDKIKVEKSKFQPKLLELVDAENLPSILGGNCKCSHVEGGCMLSDIGPWNPSGGLTNK